VPASYANASAAYPPLAQGPAYPGSSAAYTPQAHGAYPPMGQTLSHLPLMADPMGDMVRYEVYLVATTMYDHSDHI
jgi:hypothetical protein